MDERMAAILEQEMAAEQAYEMAAAFGPGETVVNVITGQRFKTAGRKPDPVVSTYTVQRKISDRVVGYKNGKPQRPWDWHVVDAVGTVRATFEKKNQAYEHANAMNAGRVS